ncbi:MAG: CoA transferase, partial [Deltaproteobacteria bacterium]|nr:CoA transferase [Deltaproteobacteria bacterium]
KGLETLKELIGISDVFAENFTPRVMKRFGLELDDLRRIRPDIIMVSNTACVNSDSIAGFLDVYREDFLFEVSVPINSNQTIAEKMVKVRAQFV